MSSVATPTLLSWLHQLFAAAWVGGLLSLALATLPGIAAALAAEGERQRVLQEIWRRLRVLALVSLVGLLVTGLLLAQRSALWHGLGSVVNTYSAVLTAKQVLTVAALAIMGVFSARRARLAGPWLAASLVLGVLLLALGALAAQLDGACVIPR